LPLSVGLFLPVIAPLKVILQIYQETAMTI
jgi:hypothetical protein